MGDSEALAAGGPLVICCADDDIATVRPVVTEFEDQGYVAVLLHGVQASPEQLAPTVELFRGEGLYVLCRSKSLGRNAVDELRDILLAHHVPFGRTLTVASARPRELRDRIRASLRRLASGKAEAKPEAEPKPKPKPKPEPKPTSTTAPKTPAVPAAPRVSPAGASTRSGTRVGLAPRPPKPEPTDFDAEAPTGVRPSMLETHVGVAPGPTPPPPPRTKSIPKPAAKVAPKPKPEPKPEPEPEPEPEPAADTKPAAEAAPAPTPTPTVAAESGKDTIPPQELTSADFADLEQLPADRELPTDLDDMQTMDMPVRTGHTTVSAPPAPPVRTGNTALVSQSMLQAAGGSPSPTPTPTPTATEPNPVLPASIDVGPGPPWKWIATGAAGLGLLAVLVVAFSGEDPPAEEEEAKNAEVAEADPEASDDPPKGEEIVLEDEAPDTPGPTRIGHALRTREIRSLDVLLVSNTEGPVSWEDAQAHCAALELAGLDAWRVPEVGELMSLTDAAMTGRGYYWSNTPADTFGDAPLVWWARKSRVVTRAKDNYVLCVRGGTGAG